MLRETNLNHSLEMINKRMKFARFYIGEGCDTTKNISFDVISEYDINWLNWSERTIDIDERILSMNLFIVFYEDDDGGAFLELGDFESVETALRLEDDFDNNWLDKDNKFYITDGNMKEINELPFGLYTMIIE